MFNKYSRHSLNLKRKYNLMMSYGNDIKGYEGFPENNFALEIKRSQIKMDVTLI